MRVLGIIINIFIPGLGTLIVGKVVAGIFQLILWLIGVVLVLTGILAIIGFPLLFIDVVWAIVTAATPKIEKQRYRE